MAKKRFTDIEIWDKEWFMELTPTHKCLVRYIFDKADASGCWKPNWKLASLHINDTVCAADLLALPKEQYEMLSNGKIFIPDFINFQYGTLSEKSPAHNPIFIAIEKNNLSNRVFNRVSKGLQEKEKEIDKEKEKDMEEKEGGEGGNIQKQNEYIVPEMLTIYQKSNPGHPASQGKDFIPLRDISQFIHTQSKLNGNFIENKAVIIKKWEQLCSVIAADPFYQRKTLSVISNQIQEIYQLQQHGNPKITKRNNTGTGRHEADGTGGY